MKVREDEKCSIKKGHTHTESGVHSNLGHIFVRYTANGDIKWVLHF